MLSETALAASAGNIQHSEGARVIAARFFIAHVALLGGVFVPLTWQLALATFLSYVSRTFVIEGGAPILLAPQLFARLSVPACGSFVEHYTPLFGATGMGWAAVVWVFFVGLVNAQQRIGNSNTFLRP